MTDFEKWFYTEDAEKFGLYPDIHSARAAWNYQETKLKEMDEVIKLQDADLRKYEKQISGLQNRIDKALIACHESGVLGVFLAVKVEDALRGES